MAKSSLSFGAETGLIAAPVQFPGKTMTRPPKKSETLEIRIPYDAKQAFMARCQEEGVSASEAVRGFIESQVAPPALALAPARPRYSRLKAALAAAAALAVGATALPSLAGQVDRSGFERFDLDHDGVVTLAEFARLDRDHDGAVSLDELLRR